MLDLTLGHVHGAGGEEGRGVGGGGGKVLQGTSGQNIYKFFTVTFMSVFL